MNQAQVAQAAATGATVSAGVALVVVIFITLYEFKRKGRQWISYFCGMATLALLGPDAVQTVHSIVMTLIALMVNAAESLQHLQINT